jgi:hypothetical protein
VRRGTQLDRLFVAWGWSDGERARRGLLSAVGAGKTHAMLLTPPSFVGFGCGGWLATQWHGMALLCFTCLRLHCFLFSLAEGVAMPT